MNTGKVKSSHWRNLAWPLHYRHKGSSPSAWYKALIIHP